jgi:hypothetical protein
MGMFDNLNKLDKQPAKSRSETPKAPELSPHHPHSVPEKPSPTVPQRPSEATDIGRLTTRHVATPQQPSEERRNEITNVPTNERTFQRRKIRHTFDIYDDQLLSLREIAIERQKVFGERVLLGDLVQEALDMFIAKERNKE